MERTMVFTGKPAYTTKKLRDLQRRGWVISRSHRHPDGTTTYVMSYVGKK
jgi:hypothetical protein